MNLLTAASMKEKWSLMYGQFKQGEPRLAVLDRHPYLKMLLDGSYPKACSPEVSFSM